MLLGALLRQLLLLKFQLLCPLFEDLTITFLLLQLLLPLLLFDQQALSLQLCFAFLSITLCVEFSLHLLQVLPLGLISGRKLRSKGSLLLFADLL